MRESNMSYKLLKNEKGEIVGVEFNEQLSLAELESAYPRYLYPKEWEKLDKGDSTVITTSLKNKL